MDPRRTQEQIGLFPVTLPAGSNAAQVEAIVAEAARNRDAAIGAGLRRGLGSIAKAIVGVGKALLSFPERQSTMQSLRQLSDRELADIGLTRADIVRVFEPGFRAPGRAANANQVPVGSRPKAA